MPPIFPPRSNLIARASIVIGLVLFVAVFGFLVWYVHTSPFTGVGVKVPQPVPYPHSLHVAALGLNCRYCHDAVDKAQFADIPPTETCMTCHSQIQTGNPVLAPVRDSWTTGNPIQWNHVNRLPGYAYFNHQIHVAKGIGCETCHGRVDTMETDEKVLYMYMGWCYGCHIDPAKYIRPVDQVYTMGYQPPIPQDVLGPQLVKEYNILPTWNLHNCSICHR